MIRKLDAKAVASSKKVCAVIVRPNGKRGGKLSGPTQEGKVVFGL
jgi:hypothetical protein